MTCSIGRAFLMPSLGPGAPHSSFVLEAPPLLSPPSCQHPAQRAGSVPHPSASIAGTGTGQPTVQESPAPVRGDPLRYPSQPVSENNRGGHRVCYDIQVSVISWRRPGPKAHQLPAWGSPLPHAQVAALRG